MTDDETRDRARLDFLDELAEQLSLLIQAGVSAEEVRADFEAQMSLQMWTDDPPGQALAAWAATQPADNYVYEMDCGHEHDSPFRRTEGVIVTCSVHGPARLVSGDFTTAPVPWSYAAGEESP